MSGCPARCRLATAVLLAVLTAACAGPSVAGPSQPALLQRFGAVRHMSGSYGDLLYVATNRQTFVVTYPQGDVVATIPSPSYGTCSNASGDVFLTLVGSIVEYAHGGTTPIGSAPVPGTAFSCSVDPTTGNIAVVVYCTMACKGDEVAVFSNLSSSPATYQDSAVPQLLYCGYDASGNLYVDGYHGAAFGLLKLSKGSGSFSEISLDKNITQAGQVQWDGQYLAIERVIEPKIFQISVSGSAATIVNTISLRGVGNRAAESWIEDGVVAVPTGRQGKRPSEVGFWEYPKGGERQQLIKGFINGRTQINGVTFSVGSGDEP
jgi:hypothetical protein